MHDNNFKFASTDDRCFAKHLKISEFKILYQEQLIFRTFGSIFISHSSWNLYVQCQATDINGVR